MAGDVKRPVEVTDQVARQNWRGIVSKVSWVGGPLRGQGEISQSFIKRFETVNGKFRAQPIRCWQVALSSYGVNLITNLHWSQVKSRSINSAKTWVKHAAQNKK